MKNQLFIGGQWSSARWGIGRERGERGLNNYLETKQITTDRRSARWASYIKE